MSSDCSSISCFQQIFEKKVRIYLWSSGSSDFSVSSSTFLTAFLLPIFVSAEPNQTIFSIDRSESKFKSHAGGKITKNFKNDGNFEGFCQFSAKSDSKLFRPDQQNERRDIQLLIEKRSYFCQTFTDDARCPLHLIWLESWNLKGIIEENLQKNMSGRYCVT